MRDQLKVLKLNLRISNLLLTGLFLLMNLVSSSVLRAEDFVDQDERDLEALESQLEDFRKDQEGVVQNITPDQLKKTQALQEAIKAGDQEKVKALTEELTKSLKSGSTQQMKQMVAVSLKSFQAMNETELRAHLLAKTSGNPVGSLLTQFPKLMDFLVQSLRDPIAIPQFFSILEKKSKLLLFFIINVAIWLVAFIVKKAHKAKSAGLGTHFKRWLFFFTLRLALFVGFFYTEISPFLHIANKTLLA